MKKIIILILLFGTLSLWQTCYAEVIFIFNPEARVAELNQVKTGLQHYLSSKGISSEIYIFANPVDLEDSVDRLKPDVGIVASYYYLSMKQKFGWNEILSGHNRGEKEYSKVLVTLKSISDPLQLRGKSLAAVSLGAASLSYIDSQLPAGLTTNDLRVVTVSKDIDAIMALGFEQVHAAIVTDDSFKRMETINPDAVKNLKILQQLPPISFPKIAIFPHAADSEKYRSIFQQIVFEGQARQVLRFFGVTGFEK